MYDTAVPAVNAAVTRVLYLDSSAIVKLILVEPQSAALRTLFASWPSRASSALARVEVPRAVQRATCEDPEASEETRNVLSGFTLIAITDDLLDIAAHLGPLELRSLDAIHVASALSLGSVLGALVSYDDRLSTAARTAGMHVLSPA